MVRGILDEYTNQPSRGDEETVEVRVRVEHKTGRALQVSQDGGQTVVWVPLSAIVRSVPEVYGPGDTIVIEVSERTAEQKELL